MSGSAGQSPLDGGRLAHQPGRHPLQTLFDFGRGLTTIPEEPIAEEPQGQGMIRRQLLRNMAELGFHDVPRIKSPPKKRGMTKYHDVILEDQVDHRELSTHAPLGAQCRYAQKFLFVGGNDPSKSHNVDKKASKLGLPVHSLRCCRTLGYQLFRWRAIEPQLSYKDCHERARESLLHAQVDFIFQFESDKIVYGRDPHLYWRRMSSNEDSVIKTQLATRIERLDRNTKYWRTTRQRTSTTLVNKGIHTGRIDELNTFDQSRRAPG